MPDLTISEAVGYLFAAICVAGIIWSAYPIERIACATVFVALVLFLS